MKDREILDVRYAEPFRAIIDAEAGRTSDKAFLWGGQDSNLGRLRRRFYRPLPLAARAPPRTHT